MANNSNYELEERLLAFAKNVRKFFLSKKLNLISQIDVKQLIRSSGSIGANYIEGNEAMSPKDKKYRMKISRKEAKETIYWIDLIEIHFQGEPLEELRSLKDEAEQLKKILSAIINKLS